MRRSASSPTLQHSSSSRRRGYLWDAQAGRRSYLSDAQAVGHDAVDGGRLHLGPLQPEAEHPHAALPQGARGVVVELRGVGLPCRDTRPTVSSLPSGYHQTTIRYYHQTTIRLPSDYHHTTIRLPSYYHQTTIRLPSDYHQTTIRLPSDYHHTTIILPSYYHHTPIRLPSYYHHTTTLLTNYLPCRDTQPTVTQPTQTTTLVPSDYHQTTIRLPDPTGTHSLLSHRLPRP